MSIFDILSVVVVVALGIVGFGLGFFNTLNALTALVASYYLTEISLNGVLGLLERFGIRENLYSPIIVFLFVFVAFWGAIYSIFYNVFSRWNEKIPKLFGIIPGLVLGLAFEIVLCQVLFGFVGEEKITSNCKVCLKFTDTKIFSLLKKKPFIYQDVVKNALVVTKEDRDVVVVDTLPDNAPISSSNEEGMLEIINAFRLENGVLAVQRDSALDALAQGYAKEILKTKRFSHLDIESKMPEDRAKENKINFNYLGENLVIAPSISKAHRALVESDEHKDNLIQPLFRRVGICVMSLGQDGVLVVQEFSN